MAQTVCVVPGEAERVRLTEVVGDRSATPEARAAGAHRAFVGRALAGARGRKASRRQPARRVALAAALRRRGRRRSPARQDATVRHAAAHGWHRRRGARAHLLRATRGGDALDRARRRQSRSASRCAPSNAFGRGTICSRIACAPSSARTTRLSPRRSRTSSAST